MATKPKKPDEAAVNAAAENETPVTTEETTTADFSAGSGIPVTTEEATAAESASGSGKPSPQRKPPIFVYVGPSLPGAILKSNTVLNGSLEEIKGYYSELLGNYPEIKYDMVKRLIVPLSQLATSRQNIEKPGNILNKYCTDLAAEIQKVRERLHGNGGKK
ncbi:MAG: hypothetical protein FWC70_10030 [Defluviitaleaceae bacterium]|nr:hypothetical protein [Defluviitaleaceae bacterium]